eukprot:comp6508_c0_seq1/m.2282 comp6508_c0_seq1/g.2282  ORF comp6508_c0_seq1/g.2282 comp6508_c0_seq1/m.2282 type:complete len:208 (-) comp6508_c0_seq1:79-702(-)
MSKKKGLSFEEKRTRLLEIFHDSKSFYQLKELEKIAPKEKGIISQSVKEVLQSLVDDGLVDTEKVGTSVYFWSFPSKVFRKRTQQVAQLGEQVAGLKKRRTELDKVLAQAAVGKEDSDERSDLLAQLSTEHEEEKRLAAELAAFADCNPEILEKKRKMCKVAIEAANRWTDNIFSIRHWTKSKFGFEEDAFNKHFGIPADFDYVDVP